LRYYLPQFAGKTGTYEKKNAVGLKKIRLDRKKTFFPKMEIALLLKTLLH